MPTTKPRYTFTDTGDLRGLLDQAQRRWPEVEDRKELLLRLVRAGGDALGRTADDRRRAAEETAGALSGIYAPDELERLRGDWSD